MSKRRLNDHTRDNTTAREARQELLKGAPALVRHKLSMALGAESDINPGYVHEPSMAEVWEAIVPMMQKESDTVKLQIESANDILGLIAADKVSVAEALTLAKMMKEISDITDLKEMKEQLDKIAEIQTR